MNYFNSVYADRKYTSSINSLTSAFGTIHYKCTWKYAHIPSIFQEGYINSHRILHLLMSALLDRSWLYILPLFLKIEMIHQNHDENRKFKFSSLHDCKQTFKGVNKVRHGDKLLRSATL